MITTVTLDNSAGTPVTIHEVSGIAKRALISAKGLVGLGTLRAAKRVRPSAHGSINETRWEEGRTINLEGEITGATVAEAMTEFRAVTTPMLQTLDVAPALLKWEETGGNKLQMAVKLDSDILPVQSGVAPRLVYQAALFGEDPRAYSQTQATSKGSALTGTILEQKFCEAGVTTRPVVVCVDAGHIYWIDRVTKAIGRAAIGGGTVEREWVKTVYTPWSLAIDAGHVYWGATNPANPTRYIGRAAIGGGTIENTWINTGTGSQKIYGLAVDASFIYWTRENYIGRAAIGGTGAEEPWKLNAPAEPTVLAQDATYLYCGETTISRINKSTNEVQQEWITKTGYVSGLAVNATNIFWVTTARRVGRAKLDGSEFRPAFIPGLASEPRGLAADASHLYIGESSGFISRTTSLSAGPTGSATTVTNAGSPPTPVTFKLTGTVVNPVIIAAATGERIAFTGTITTPNYLEINTQNRTVLLNGKANALSLVDAQNTNWAAFEAPAGASETYELSAISATGATLEALYRSAYS